MSNPFDLGGMSGLLSGFQQKMKEIQDECHTSQYTATSGGVTVVVNGSNEIISISIDDESLEDKELLEDILVGTINKAQIQAKQDLQQKMSQLTAGLPIPPGMLNF
jgi:nucleoid-associated protein EbfC